MYVYTHHTHTCTHTCTWTHPCTHAHMQHAHGHTHAHMQHAHGHTHAHMQHAHGHTHAHMHTHTCNMHMDTPMHPCNIHMDTPMHTHTHPHGHLCPHSQILKEFGCVEDFTIIDFRLFLCTLACSFSLFALVYDYLRPFPASCYILATCAIRYPIHSGPNSVQ